MIVADATAYGGGVGYLKRKTRGGSLYELVRDRGSGVGSGRRGMACR